MLDSPVLRANHHCLATPLGACLPCSRTLWRTTSTTLRSQLVLREPVPHRRGAPPDRIGDLCEGRTVSNKRLQPLTAHSPFGGVLLGAHSSESVPPEPIRDGRFVETHTPPYLRERQSLAKQRLQRCPIHALHCRRRLGRKKRTRVRAGGVVRQWAPRSFLHGAIPARARAPPRMARQKRPPAGRAGPGGRRSAPPHNARYSGAAALACTRARPREWLAKTTTHPAENDRVGHPAHHAVDPLGNGRAPSRVRTPPRMAHQTTTHPARTTR
jgi:hypothetical protein